MKTITINIDYRTLWGQSVHLLGSIPTLGEWDEEKSIALKCTQDSCWSIDLQIPKETNEIEFKFFITQNNKIVGKEYGFSHKIKLSENKSEVNCLWQEKPMQAYFRTSMFSNSIFYHPIEQLERIDSEIQLIVSCIHIDSSQELVISGSNNTLGNWQEDLAIPLSCIAYGKWHTSFKHEDLPNSMQYKFAIRKKDAKQITEWEEGDNRVFLHNHTPSITELNYKRSWINWKAAGVAIPVFSLRSESSYGIGEFSDLNLLVDWAQKTRMRIIQILPINDTTATYSWRDSYPYNAISIYALNPIYLALHEYPLRNKKENDKYLTEARILNLLDEIDYTSVIKLKTEYIKALYEEIGEDTLSSPLCQKFRRENTDWLDTYAAFCYFRDKYDTTNTKDWGEFAIYEKEKIDNHFLKNREAAPYIARVIFTQFLLHKQLTEAKEYAYKHGVVLKGDIPIGVSPSSVEVWKEPHLFNLNSQTGAPPDNFAQNGQNWGFPTYKWAEMKKDNYNWWTKRFQKMADYFDAYRIDHILGFFRIWEIPKTAVHGLLGYFSPALSLSEKDIESWRVTLNLKKSTIPSIHKCDIANLFGPYWSDISKEFLYAEGDYYFLKPVFDNQRKIKNWFEKKIKKVSSQYLQEGLENTKVAGQLQNGLYKLCNEVFFIEDKYEKDKYHPRISLQNSFSYKRLDDDEKVALDKLYENYFYHRHSKFWRNEAMSKLPTLIGATDMLVCGEDLGMVPESVPSVMKDLEILSLEIQRMPKDLGVKYSKLETLPYLSVSTTSTHDMSPIRMWWEEDKENTQEYYNSALKIDGEAPEKCTPAICTEIIKQHLQSSAMLTILPLQDWLSIDGTLRRKNAEKERINIPSNPQHNWNYRMHITLEKLNEEKQFMELVRLLNKESDR